MTPTQAVIPAYLTSVDHWVCWRLENRKGEPTKVPIDPHSGRRASSTDPTTWASYAEARRGEGRFRARGVGYVFTAEAGIVGVDLDHCRDAQTGAIEEWAQEIVDELGSYSEFSPSGTGVHVFCRAALPPGGRKRGGIEMYSEGRFFTITGQHLDGTPITLEERTAELAELHARIFAKPKEDAPSNGRDGNPSSLAGTVDLADGDLIEKARRAKNGATFWSLWNGDTSAHSGDDSVADLALCCHLAFWTAKDPARIDRLFRRSGLFREKWDARRGAESYGERTIRTAIEHTSETYTPRAIPVVNGRTSPNGETPTTGDGQEAEQKKPDAGDDGAGLTKTLADAITAETHFSRDRSERLYRFADGTYRPDGESFVRMRVKHLLEEWQKTKSWTKHLSTEVAEYIRVDAAYLWEEPPTDEINVKNGILDLRTRTLRPHGPEFRSSLQLPVVFDSTKGCPAIDRFVSEVFPQDAQRLAYEIPAVMMRPGMLQKKVVLLIGSGNNGKSVYLAVVTTFLGRRNVAGLSLQKLEMDRFAPARLLGKLANICPDLPSTHLESVSTFKAITGRDYLNAEFKYENSFEFVPFSRLLFSANSYPRSSDNSPGFFDRWHPVPFDRTFQRDDETPRDELEARLTTSEELSGLLNRVLDVLPHVLKRGYTESESTRRAKEEFHATTDPLAIWLEHFTVESPDAVTAKWALMNAYNADCHKAGRPTLSKSAFGITFRRLRPNVTETQRTIGGKVTWAWVGIGMVSPEDSLDCDDSRASRTSRTSTNCLFPGLPRDLSYEEDEDEEGVKNNNIEKSVKSVKPVNGPAVEDGLA